ncbi:hypothetical protein GCM10027037_09780 [Mucilaginibacter koreensis]
MFGINAYEWNFLQDPAHPADADKIYEPKMALAKSFTGVRHYLDWMHLEPERDHYTFNPSRNGSWNYDAMYERCKKEGMLVLACIKTCPQWLVDTYPTDQRDNENVPAPYGANRSLPASYLQQAKMAFRFAARYGANTKVNRALVKVDTTRRWNGDAVNEIKIGLNTVHYMECDNERDKWWKGDKAHQTAEEYAANLSAFYDGDQGRLGKNAGVKNADPSMQVVMAGLADPNLDYLKAMVEWCKKHRGYKPNGQVDLCFDVVNYHFYSANDNLSTHELGTTGISPETSQAAQLANQFVNYANSLTNKPPVWITEAGYDINQKSIQRAAATPSKPALMIQADWIVRTALLYARYGINRLFFYQLFDDTPNSEARFATSGLSEETKLRPAADYILQLRKLMGNYRYEKTVNQQPLIDIYRQGNKTLYVITNTDDAHQINYNFKTLNHRQVALYRLNAGGDAAVKTILTASKNQVALKLSGTPVVLEEL